MNKDKRRYKILVVEDNPGDLLIIETLLFEKIESPVIMQARNFHQASEILSEVNQTFDVILLDLTLPDIAGQELVTAMLHKASQCPIIIFTGHTDLDFSTKSISQGISDYLLKDELTAMGLYKSIIYSYERKKSVFLLEESEKRYSDLFYLSPQPMWLFDPDTFRFLQVNKAAITLYGYTEQEFLRMSVMDIKSQGSALEMKKSIKRRNSKDSVLNRMITHHKKSGELIEVEIYSTPIIIGTKKIISVIAIDITEKNITEQKIIKAIIKTQEDERYEIGGELHDNVCQILSASQMNLSMIKKSLDREGMIYFNECKQNISLALLETRNLSHQLAPAFFEDSTLEEAFRRLFSMFTITKGMNIELFIDKAVTKYPISREIQLNLYRILQEQLRNIQKYAKASLINVDLLIHDQLLSLIISDNGIGFNANNVKEGIGLANMKRRTELFSGRFEIYTSPGHGCEVVVDIPLAEIK